MTIFLYKKANFGQDFNFKSQLCRASISIMNNIAEGFERQTDKELRQFLNMAKGSAAEVRSMLYLANDLGYIDQAEFTKLINLSIEIAKMLNGFIKSIKQ